MGLPLALHGAQLVSEKPMLSEALLLDVTMHHRLLVHELQGLAVGWWLSFRRNHFFFYIF